MFCPSLTAMFCGLGGKVITISTGISVESAVGTIVVDGSTRVSGATVGYFVKVGVS